MSEIRNFFELLLAKPFKTMANCHLCKNFFEEILPLKGPEQVEAYNFMSSEAIGNGDSVGVCKTCSQKIEIIVGIKQSSKPSEAQLQPSPASKTEPSPTKQKKVANENIDEEEDVDLEELDQLSSYYAGVFQRSSYTRKNFVKSTLLYINHEIDSTKYFSNELKLKSPSSMQCCRT